MKRRGRGKAPRGRGATTGGVESKERGESSREKETGEETDKASRGREMSKRESGEIDEGRGGTAEATRSGQCIPLGSRSTGSLHTSAAKELVEEDKSETVGVSSI